MLCSAASDGLVLILEVLQGIKGNGYIFRGRHLCQNCFASFLKKVHSKRKEFAPSGSKFFRFRVDPFSEAKQTECHKSCLPCERNRRIQSPEDVPGFSSYHSLRIFSRWQIYNIFLIFPHKKRSAISCKLSPQETICMKCLFSWKNKKNVFCWIFNPANKRVR